MVTKLLSSALLTSLIFLFAPITQATDSPVVILTKVKNITQGDNPEGFDLTRAIGGDALSHLIMVHNTSEETITDLAILNILPQYTGYTNNSTEIYRHSAWQSIEDDFINTPFPLDQSGLTIDTLTPNEIAYIKFSSQINDVLPQEDTIISNLSAIYLAGEEITRDQTSVIIPRRTIQTDTKDIPLVKYAAEVVAASTDNPDSTDINKGVVVAPLVVVLIMIILIIKKAKKS